MYPKNDLVFLFWYLLTFKAVSNWFCSVVCSVLCSCVYYILRWCQEDNWWIKPSPWSREQRLGLDRCTKKGLWDNCAGCHHRGVLMGNRKTWLMEEPRSQREHCVSYLHGQGHPEEMRDRETWHRRAVPARQREIQMHCGERAVELWRVGPETISAEASGERRRLRESSKCGQE